MADDRPFDIILWGATGFVGRLTAEVFARRHEGLRWAIAGRSRARLAEIHAELELGDVEMLIGDAHDRASLDELARSARVICTTVGPYAKYGSELVAACVAAGTHYCDLTGEAHWIREMIDRHHAEARERGIRITHCCGFDSIPSDLGALLLQETAMERFGEPCERVRNYVMKMKGGFSGGTLDSMANVVQQARSDENVRKVLLDPYGLNPEGERDGPDGRDEMGAEYDEDEQTWVGPFIMATVNKRIVRRSNALLDWRYGRDFSYSEVTRFGSGLKGRVAANAMGAAMGGLVAGFATAPIRKLLRAVLPSPGEGPSAEAIEKGMFHCRHVGRCDGETVAVDVRGRRDPGYGATATMLAAAAACLANDDLETDGGILTPASAMGHDLIDRLNEDGEVTITVAD